MLKNILHNPVFKPFSVVWLILLVCILPIVTFAQNSRGTIKGKVLAADSLPAAYVPVGIKGTTLGTTTDVDGRYQFKAPEGSHTLSIQFVGHEPEEKQVEVKAGETTQVEEFRLRENSKELQEVLIVSAKELKTSSEQLNRMPINYLEDGQSYSSVQKETIKEIGATDMQTALRVIPGLASANTDGYGYVTSYARGFQIQPRFRNGIAVSGITGGDIQNVERLELLRGPAGTLFGTPGSSWDQSYGGIINKVTKTAFNGTLVEGSLINGSYGLIRAGADVNVVLSKENNVFFRMNSAYQSEHSWQMIDMKRKDMHLAPVLVYEPSKRLSFKLEAEMNSSDYPSMFYFTSDGLDLSKKRRIDELGLNYNRNYSDPGFNHPKPVTQNFFAGQAKYKFNPNWNLTLDIQKTVYNHANGAVFNTFLQDTLMIRDWYDYDYKWNNSTYMANVNGKIKIGKITNNVLAGVSFLDRYDNGGGKYSYAATDRLDTINLNQDLMPTVDAARVRAGATSGEAFTWRSAVQSYGAYMADQIDIGEKLHVFLSLRYDHFFNRTNKVNQSTDKDWDKGAWSPRLGVVYEVVKGKMSVFGNHATSFKYNAPTLLQTLKPEYATQYEGGVKLQLAQNITSTISYYDITVQNMVRPNPNDPLRPLQDGTRTSKGMDIEAVASPIKGLKITTGYGYNESKLVKVADASTEGKRAASTSLNSATLWATYKLQTSTLKGIGVGFGGSHYGENYFNDQNTLVIPAYTILNTSIFYEAEKWRIGVNFNNITDQRYWSTAGNPQKPFNFLANFSIKI